MTRIRNWNNRYNNDYKFIDRSISEWMGMSGTIAYVHLYLGTYSANGTPSLTTIQDVLLMENRNRAYSENVYEMACIYTLNEYQLDLTQFGLMTTTDSVFIDFHYQDMLTQIGRKLIAGDVLELPHRRDDSPLSGPAQNKYYVVSEGEWPAVAYSPTWYPHIWRVKCDALTNSQEYADIMSQQTQNPLGLDAGTLADILNGYSTANGVTTATSPQMAINQQVVAQAKADMLRRNFETQQYYVIPGDELGSQNPWVFAGDGIPPDGAQPVGSGNRFPENPQEEDYFLRIDYAPHTLFRYTNGKWVLQELAYRSEWTAMHRMLESFIQYKGVSELDDGTVIQQKQGLSQMVKPKADF
jgi:hypothetical protein